MSMACPQCASWTSVKETRTRKTNNVVVRRYECANLHRFTTEERVRQTFEIAATHSVAQPFMAFPKAVQIAGQG